MVLKLNVRQVFFHGRLRMLTRDLFAVANLVNCELLVEPDRVTGDPTRPKSLTRDSEVRF